MFDTHAAPTEMWIATGIEKENGRGGMLPGWSAEHASKTIIAPENHTLLSEGGRCERPRSRQGRRVFSSFPIFREEGGDLTPIAEWYFGQRGRVHPGGEAFEAFATELAACRLDCMGQ